MTATRLACRRSKVAQRKAEIRNATASEVGQWLTREFGPINHEYDLDAVWDEQALDAIEETWRTGDVSR